MKRVRFVYLLFSLGCLYILLSSHSTGQATGFNDDRTGAPGAGLCSGCHSGGSYGTINVVINIFQHNTTFNITTYIAGTLYDVRVTVNHSAGTPAGYGFEMTCLTQTANTPLAGYSLLGANVKQKTVTTGTFNGRTYTEHNGVTNNNIFNMSWTAPASGTGAVVFYVSGNCINGNSMSSGDNPGNISLVLPESFPPSVTGTNTNVSCFGGNNGTITLIPSGGTLPYGYSWSSGATTQNLSGLASGTYIVTITDASSVTASASFTITQPAAALGITGSATDVLCNGGNTGSISITGIRGTSPYTYDWGGGVTSRTRIGLTSGTYTVTVTDNNGCSASASYTVSQPNVFAVNHADGTILCFGGTGTVNITASGGTLPYTGTGTFNQSAGPQNYIVTDANGCSSSIIVTLIQPAQLIATANTITIPCSGGSGTITVTATGGTPPYTGTGIFNVSTPGTYTYTVTDFNGCTFIATGTAIASSGFTANDTLRNATCNGNCDAGIDVTVVGGTSPYTYSWSNGATTPNISSLCAGNYQQTIHDNAGCTVINNYIVNQPDSLLVSVLSVQNDNGVGDGAIQISIGGGTPGYRFTWSNGDSMQNISNLHAGNYSVTVTDSNGCSKIIPDISVLINDGIPEISKRNINLYPNPVTAQLFLNISASTDSHLQIRIFSLDGLLVKQIERIKNPQWLDVSNLPPSIYILEAANSSSFYRAKFMRME